MTCEFRVTLDMYCGNDCNDDLLHAPIEPGMMGWIYLCQEHRDHYWPMGVPEDCIDEGYDDEDEEEFENESILEGIDDENPYD